MTEQIERIARAIETAGGRAYIVGGFIRDRLMGQPSNDIDITVTGLTIDELRGILSQFGTTAEPEGEQSFPVIKLGDLDFALARRDNRTGIGFADVEFETNNVTIDEDLARRDLAINAIAQDILTGELIDPFGGQEDAKIGRLRAINAHFGDSVERGLRLVQFAARFGKIIDNATISLALNLAAHFDRIPEAQIRQQFMKMFAKGRDFEAALVTLELIGHARFFPGLIELSLTPQDPRHHPEGDALRHTAQTMTAMAIICDQRGIEGDDRAVRLAAMLIHDLGKIDTTRVELDGRITSHGHAEIVANRGKKLLAAISFPKRLQPKAIALAELHMRPHEAELTDAAIRRLARRLGEAGATIDELTDVAIADKSGRKPGIGLPELVAHPEAEAMRSRAAELAIVDAKPEPILKGRHLIDHLSLKPGSHFGPILREVEEAQMDGAITTLDEALQLAQAIIAQS